MTIYQANINTYVKRDFESPYQGMNFSVRDVQVKRGKVIDDAPTVNQYIAMVISVGAISRHTTVQPSLASRSCDGEKNHCI